MHAPLPLRTTAWPTCWRQLPRSVSPSILAARQQQRTSWALSHVMRSYSAQDDSAAEDEAAESMNGLPQQQQQQAPVQQVPKQGGVGLKLGATKGGGRSRKQQTEKMQAKRVMEMQDMITTEPTVIKHAIASAFYLGECSLTCKFTDLTQMR